MNRTPSNTSAGTRALVMLLWLGFCPAGFATTTTTINPNGDILGPGVTVNHTQIGSPAFAGSFAFDNLVRATPADGDHGFVFQGTESFDGGFGINQQLLSVSGFTPTAITQILLYAIVPNPDRIPSSVIVRSSTTSTSSLIAGDYETILGTFTLNASAFTTAASTAAPAADSFYATLNVAAPAGTQSLYFDFDGSTHGTRMQEIQAFGVVPEPGRALLGLLGVTSLTLRRRRTAQREPVV